MSRELSGVMDQLIVGWNSHDPDQVLPFYHPACQGIDVGQARPQNGREGIRQTLRRYWDAFPDLTIVNHEMVIQDERAAVSWVGRGTHHGHMMNIPPTHRAVEVRGMSFFQFEDGLVIRSTHVWDVAGLLRALRLLPELE